MVTDKPKPAQSKWFCAGFFAIFCSVSRFLSTPNFQKSTPNFSAALTFESLVAGNFAKIRVSDCGITNYLKFSIFAFFRPKVFSFKIIAFWRGLTVQFYLMFNNLFIFCGSNVAAQSCQNSSRLYG